jgi:2-dehydro-3-deoxyphosphogluconate aldolase/(4S)-4-hydroxy-2-oxoglutarate aldolase
MNTEQGLKLLEQEQMLVIARGIDQTAMNAVAEALLAGGVRVLEITMNTAHATNMIRELHSKYKERLWIGAGTVITLEDAKMAVDCGAQFLVTPNTDPAVIEFARQHGVPIFPGAFTPTEIVQAWQAGATAVKIFPGGQNNLSFIKELQGPLGHIPMIALGGIHAQNVSSFIRMGCFAVGVGTSILLPDAIREQNYHQITIEAKKIVDAIHLAKFDEKHLLK